MVLVDRKEGRHDVGGDTDTDVRVLVILPLGPVRLLQEDVPFRGLSSIGGSGRALSPTLTSVLTGKDAKTMKRNFNQDSVWNLTGIVLFVLL